jgi:membrane protein implicated in regulation of membrane protease activity
MLIKGPRPVRRRNELIAGLTLEGESNVFAWVAWVLIAGIGALLLWMDKSVTRPKLQEHTVVLHRTPYELNAGRNNLFVLPVANGRFDLKASDAAWKAAKQEGKIKLLAAGDTLQVYADEENSSRIKNIGRFNYAFVKLVYRHGEGIISEQAYNRATSSSGQTGWWLLALALALVPYFFVQNPKLPAKWVMAAFVIAFIIWVILKA